MDVKSALFREDIQGLRAVAVLAVILFHLPGGFAPNGFIGVDVFYVISGYVITGSICHTKATSEVGLIFAFFRKRIARLFPALLVCILCTLVTLGLLQPPGVAKMQAAQTGLYALSGMSNFFLLDILNDYWFEGVRLNPFVHTWSLSVEFQFYLVFPFLFVAFLTLSKVNRRRVAPAALIVLGALASLYLFLAAPAGSMAAFYMPQYRLWEFSLGVGAYAMTTLSCPRALRRFDLGRIGLTVLKYLPITLLVGVCFSWIAAPERKFVGVVACLLTAAVLVINKWYNWTETGPLATGVFRKVGDASYSTYLYHWPVILFYGWIRGFEGLVDYALCMAAIAVLSIASWRFVETGGRVCSRNWYGLVATSAIMIVVFGIAERPQAFRGEGRLGPFVEPLYRSFIWPVDVHSLNVEWWRYYESDEGKTAHPWKFGLPEIHREWSEEAGSRISTVNFGRQGSGKTIVVLGDSYAESSMPMVVEYAAKSGTSIVAYHIFREWEAAFRSIRGVVDSHPGDIPFVLCATTSRSAESPFERYLPSLVDDLNKKGIPVVMQGATPEFLGYMPKVCLSPLKDGRRDCPEFTPASDQFKQVRKVEIRLARYADRFANVMIWRPMPMFCDDRICRIKYRGMNLFRDENHLSVRGSLFLAEHFSDFVASSLPIRRASGRLEDRP